jgi:hypothetical protein
VYLLFKRGNDFSHLLDGFDEDACKVIGVSQGVEDILEIINA